MILQLISIYCNCVCHWSGNAFLWHFSMPVHWYSHLKKQSCEQDVVGRVQNYTCQVRLGVKMQYVNVKIHDN